LFLARFFLMQNFHHGQCEHTRHSQANPLLASSSIAHFTLRFILFVPCFTEFPNDYRNGIRWYHYDPTKWLILALNSVGFARNLKEFPMNEIKRGQIYMKEKKLAFLKSQVVHPKPVDSLPLMSWSSFRSALKDEGRSLLIVDGVVHDVTSFIPLHPGGELIIKGYVGTDCTKVFRGQTEPVLYKHSHAAMNLLSNLRVARIDPQTVPQKEEPKKTQ
jgi:stearoyl-CoA desaturase (delta-9 desaturase)